MKLYYENTDITDYIVIKSCEHRDVSGGRCDSLEIVFENAAKWFSWGPKQDDKMEASLNGYTTGTLYLNTIIPEDGRFRIIATSMPSTVYMKAWKSYENMTLSGIMRACAAECRMGWKVFGLDENMQYPFLLRKNEGCTAFLHRLMEWEGAQLKCVNGRLIGIGVEYAQAKQAKQQITIDTKQPGVYYRRHDGMKYAGILIKTPYAAAEAIDAGADTVFRPVFNDIPALNSIQAGRWARGMLLNHNRKAEELNIQQVFQAGMTALARVDADSRTDEGGEWIIHEAVHDFVNEKTRVKLLRCITTVQ